MSCYIRNASLRNKLSLIAVSDAIQSIEIITELLPMLHSVFDEPGYNGELLNTCFAIISNALQREGLLASKEGSALAICLFEIGTYPNAKELLTPSTISMIVDLAAKAILDSKSPALTYNALDCIGWLLPWLEASKLYCDFIRVMYKTKQEWFVRCLCDVLWIYYSNNSTSEDREAYYHLLVELGKY